MPEALVKRRRWDSNQRCARHERRFSRPLRSTALALLQFLFSFGLYYIFTTTSSKCKVIFIFFLNYFLFIFLLFLNYDSLCLLITRKISKRTLRCGFLFLL